MTQEKPEIQAAAGPPAGDSSNLPGRRRVGKSWETVFRVSTIIGMIALSALLYNILKSSFGYAAIEDELDPTTLAVNGVQLADLPKDNLVTILKDHVSSGVYRRLEKEKSFEERDQREVYDLVIEKVVKPQVRQTWSLYASILARDQIDQELADKYPKARLEFRSWLNAGFLYSTMSSNALIAGVRTAVLGSLWTILITILVAFPVGVGAAVYLEEYAEKNRINQAIQTNINNLAGVPSIIYGMLGLTVFVRMLQPLTSGAIFGMTDPTTANGRTILSAGLTLALLVLPLIIINGQEAIRAVPQSLRQASFGLGATRWQTVWHHVLPNAIPGILTGVILAVSRAIGETAPLVVVGAATFITFDPTSVFSKFTTLPIQIYQWTARPQGEFRNLAAAAILTLLVMLLSLNAFAIWFRNKYSRRL